MAAKFGQQVKNLIIADDDPDDQLLLREAIENYTIPPLVNVVPDGLQLMSRLKLEILPDLILLDLNMPNKNGLECLTEIRADKKFRHVAIVVLSTSKNIKDIESCFSGGAHLFFPKPYTFDSLKKLIHSLLDINWEAFRELDRKEFIRIASDGLLPEKLVEA